MGIHAPIAPEIATEKLSEIQPIVQNRPQHPISEAVVIFLIVGFAEIGDDIGHIATLNRPGPDVSFGRSGSSPAEPETAVAFEQGSNSDCEAARLVVIAARERHSVGNDYQPRPNRSSQLRDNPIAAKNRPAIE